MNSKMDKEDGKCDDIDLLFEIISNFRFYQEMFAVDLSNLGQFVAYLKYTRD